MRILELLKPEAIIANIEADTKKGVLEELIVPVAAIAGIDQEKLVKVLLERERLGSTGIGNGIGIPHGKFKALEELVIGFGLSRKGVDFESIDGQPAHIFFVLMTPENSTGLHLKLLARISRILKDDSFRERLMNAADGKQIYEIIKAEDDEF